MSKTLVAFFSASGTTKKLARSLAEAVNGDLHEIIPKQRYTEEDLDWNNKNSRSSVEMSDKSYRPEIANKVENMDQVDVIYVGFPIWWYIAPSIINTFLEQYDLSGKTVIPFATSGTSAMGDTSSELKKSCKGATVKEGQRFDANTSVAELKSWAESL